VCHRQPLGISQFLHPRRVRVFDGADKEQAQRNGLLSIRRAACPMESGVSLSLQTGSSKEVRMASLKSGAFFVLGLRARDRRGLFEAAARDLLARPGLQIRVAVPATRCDAAMASFPGRLAR
jgi:hypothetical protein